VENEGNLIWVRISVQALGLQTFSHHFLFYIKCIIKHAHYSTIPFEMHNGPGGVIGNFCEGYFTSDLFSEQLQVTAFEPAINNGTFWLILTSKLKSAST